VEELMGIEVRDDVDGGHASEERGAKIDTQLRGGL
jgi:hypothetical protein